MKQTYSVLSGAYTYEFRMQVRRPAVWIAMLLIELLMVGFMSRSADTYTAITHLQNYPILNTVVIWTNIINYILPVAFGILLADRLVRERRTRVQEILTTLPGSKTARLFGKYLGSTLATLLPIFLFYCLGIGFIVAQTHNLQVLPLALATFVSIVLPGMLFVGAFSIAMPAIMWLPLYQFFFLGYWFWGNLYKPKGIPTISNTLLTPAGGYMSRGFFGLTVFPVDKATTLQGIESLFLLLGLALLTILALARYLKWQQAQQ